MASLIWTCTAFVLGVFSYTAYFKISDVVRRRLNYGQPILLDGEKIGSIVKIRYNGSKRYMIVDYNQSLVEDKRFWDVETATVAVKDAYVKIRLRDQQIGNKAINSFGRV